MDPNGNIVGIDDAIIAIGIGIAVTVDTTIDYFNDGAVNGNGPISQPISGVLSGIAQTIGGNGGSIGTGANIGSAALPIAGVPTETTVLPDGRIVLFHGSDLRRAQALLGGAALDALGATAFKHAGGGFGFYLDEGIARIAQRLGIDQV